MHITLQQEQQPTPPLIENAHPRSAKFLAFAHPGKICLIYIVNDILPISFLVTGQSEERDQLLESLLS